MCTYSHDTSAVCAGIGKLTTEISRVAPVQNLHYLTPSGSLPDPKCSLSLLASIQATTVHAQYPMSLTSLCVYICIYIYADNSIRKFNN